MQTNLINNYINTEKSKTTNFSVSPKSPSNNEEFGALSNRTYIKPLEGKGHLVKNNVFDVPAVMARSIAYDVKSLRSGLKGESNDHQLGRLNDLGMKVGGLAIAAYLFTKRSTQATKAMEFVGFGSFFASMALWPKIALQMPAKLIHGVNVQQKYVDSQGRKKDFYQDPQYIPWDLYSDKQIEKIGNRLGVDKNMPNRRDFTQEKMKKIALQNNTMWMLTAGFASPIMSALICNQAEKCTLKIQDNLKNKNADEMLEKLDVFAAKQAQSADYLTSKKQLEGFFELHREQPMTKKLVSELTEIISPNIDPLTKKAVNADLSKMFLNKPARITDDIADTIVKGVNEIFTESGIDKTITEKVVPTRDEILEIFKKSVNEKQAVDGLNPTELLNIRVNLTNSIYDKADKVANFNINDFEATTDKAFKHIDQALKKNNSSLITVENTAKIKEIAKTITDYSTKVSVLDKYALTKAGKAPETILANRWNNVSDSLLKVFNINSKEIKNSRYDRVLVQNLLRDKIETLTSCSDEEYMAKIKELSNSISKIDEKIKPELVQKYHQTVTSIFDKSATDLGKLGLDKTAQKLTAYNVGGSGSLKRLQQVFIDERIAGVKNSFYRLINTVDLYRRVSKGNFGGAGGPLDEAMKLEVRQELVELSKQMTLQGHASDHSIKFYFNRNPKPSLATGALKVEKGKIYTESTDAFGKVVKNFYKYTPEKGVDIGGDANFYKNAMRFMYESDMDATTKSSLNKNLLDGLQKYRKEFFEKIGDAEYFTKLAHRTKGGSIPKATSEEKFLLTGLAPDEMMAKIIKNTFHTNKWMKTFGYAAIGLTAITVASQFFFGKMNNSRNDSKKVKKG